MRVTILVVLYNKNINESKTLASLNSIYIYNNHIFDNFNFILFSNNENLNQSNLNLPFEYTFQKNNLNNGYAFPLNSAVRKSQEIKNTFLLIFDENTDIPTSFFINYYAQLELMLADQKCVAMVSKIFYKNYCFSPSRVYLGGLHRPILESYHGSFHKETFSILSGTTINISFLASINGFNEIFWLDSLDRWLFTSISNNDKSVYISNLLLHHDLSILDYDNKIGINRYTNILYSESLIIYEKSILHKLFYLFRLLKRVLIFRKKGMQEFSKITRDHFFELLLLRRQNLILKLMLRKYYKF